MATPIITVIDRAGYRIVSVEIPADDSGRRSTTPREAAAAVSGIEARLPGTLPVLITGAMPLWLGGMLVHAAHATPMVATFDPRLGYVVVESHDSRWARGDEIPASVVEG